MRYLSTGILHSENEKGTIGAAVIYPLGDGGCELKNIAVAEEFQGKGIGKTFLKRLMQIAAEDYEYMLVGTTSGTEGFYISSGFVYSHTIPGFFVDNYSGPIFENGVQCIDMRCFKKKLRE